MMRQGARKSSDAERSPLSVAVGNVFDRTAAFMLYTLTAQSAFVHGKAAWCRVESFRCPCADETKIDSMQRQVKGHGVRRLRTRYHVYLKRRKIKRTRFSLFQRRSIIAFSDVSCHLTQGIRQRLFMDLIEGNLSVLPLHSVMHVVKTL
jgi:hypothetical protein